jgi:drug/metabolite transporter (DMT)-like permease
LRPAHIELRSHRTAVWLALLVTVLWSSSWVLIRWGLDDEGLTPVMFAALRYGLAAIVLVGFVIVRERHGRHRYEVSRGYIAKLVLLGIVMYTLTQGAMFVALDEQPAATTSLVLSLTPLIVAGGAAITLAEVPTRWQVSGAILVAVGALLYFISPIDLIPDFIPGLGYLDDMAVVAGVVAVLADVLRKFRKHRESMEAGEVMEAKSEVVQEK